MAEDAYDVIVIGSGPAGLQAAIHAGRARASVVVLGRKAKSSLYRAHIENYCCLGKVRGEELLEQGIAQAKAAGAEFINEDVVGIEKDGDIFRLRTESGRLVRARALVLAMGVARHKLGVPGEKEFLGRGVSYCVDCDAGFFRNEPVVVVGNGSAAATGALTLLFYASEVHLVCDRLEVAEALQEQVHKSGIVLHAGRKVKEIYGNKEVEGVVLDDGSRLAVRGVFIELGAKGAVELATALGVALDAEAAQFIVTDKRQETNVPGVYAAGDVCGLPWQLAKAVGEGCVAGLEAAAYAKKKRD